MQRTRLNTLVEGTGTRLTQFFGNPWRRISLLLISLLLGFFVGSGVSTTSGQSASWDVVTAALILLFTEVVNRGAYHRRQGDNPRSLGLEILNVFKMGITYSLFLEAFKLGS